MRKKRIRRLVSDTVVHQPKSTPQRIWRGAKLGIAVVVAVAALFIVQYDSIIEELRHLSLNQYHLCVHGRSNYCQEHFDPNNITRELRHRISGQDNVLNAIESTFKLHTNFTAMALIGSQGVGKTLTLNVIEQEFQWPSNVLRYIWSSIESQRGQMMRMLNSLHRVDGCGQSAILIDNVFERDVEFIVEFQRVSKAYLERNQLRVFIFYVIQTNTPDAFDDHPLQTVNITSVFYRTFNQTDFLRCISVECERLNVKLSQDEITEIVQNTDAHQTGCKTVLAKISRYSKTEEALQ